MGDQSPQNTTNLDLNLAPVVHPSQDDQTQTMSFEDWLLGSMREVVSGHPTAIQRFPSVLQQVRVPMEPRNTPRGLTGGSRLATNERTAVDGDNDDDERPREMIKSNKNGDKCIENRVVSKEDVEKSNADEGSFFDCNICLELASEPVVTCCGHLFCWPCLYRWLFVHSESKECPICKGEVTMKTITPIYSRGNHTNVTEAVDSTVKIPSRPQANRIESWRQSFQRNILNIPMFEMIRRLDNRSDPTATNNSQESLLTRIFTSRGMRSGRDTHTSTTPVTLPDATVDPSQNSPDNSNQAARIPSDHLIETYFNDHPDERNQEQFPLMEDRHSMSSVAAVIQSGSQTTDAAAETDSRVSVSTSRRRSESSRSRGSDVDSGESRSRRRRLQ